MFTALTSKIFGGVAIVALIAIGVLYWRASDMEGQRDAAQANLATCNESVAGLRGSLAVQERQIGEWKRAAEEARARSDTALTEARRATEATRSTARAILARKPPQGVAICDAAWGLAQEPTR